MTCESAREILSREGLEAGSSGEKDVAAAREHVRACGLCNVAARRFSEAVLQPAGEPITCAEARTRITEQWAGAIGDAGLASLRSHLAGCASCAAEYAAVEQTLALAEQGALPEPPRYPVFDLSFLPQWQPGHLWLPVRAGARRLGYELPAALALLGKTLLSPPSNLALSYANSTAARRSASRQRETLVSLAVSDDQEDIRIGVNVSEAQQALWLTVGLAQLSSGKTLHGGRVALCDEDGHAQEIKTVRPGESEARFQSVQPARYLVRVDHSGKTWELPIDLRRL